MTWNNLKTVFLSNKGLMSGVFVGGFMSGIMSRHYLLKRNDDLLNPYIDIDGILKNVSTRNCLKFEKDIQNTILVEKKGFKLDEMNLRGFMRIASLYLVSTTKLDILNKKYICFNEKGLGYIMTEDDYMKYLYEWKVQLRALGLLSEFDKYKRRNVKFGHDTYYISNDKFVNEMFGLKYANLKDSIDLDV